MQSTNVVNDLHIIPDCYILFPYNCSVIWLLYIPEQHYFGAIILEHILVQMQFMTILIL